MSGATKVVRDANVSVTFREAVTGLSTTSMTLKSTKKTSVLATVSYDPASRTAILNPVATLDPGTRYTAALTKDIADLAGNRLSTQSWSFTTGT